MMLFYTLGLALLSAPLAALDWAPVGHADDLPLLAIGILAQAGQFCFLRAYGLGEASRLAPPRLFVDPLGHRGRLARVRRPPRPIARAWRCRGHSRRVDCATGRSAYRSAGYMPPRRL